MGWRYEIDEIAAQIGCAAPEPGGAPITGVSTDTRTLEPGALFVALTGPNFNAEHFVAEAFARGAAGALCREPHPEGPCLAVPDPLAAFQALARRHRMAHDIPILAITGSCGKTTAKDLTSAVLESRYRVLRTQGNLNNDIGCPLTLMRIDRETEFAVIEMGANHQGEIAHLCTLARPSESVVTIVAPAHLEGFGSIDDVARAKGEIVRGLDADGCFYQNMDNPYCRAMGWDFPGEIVRFGREGDVVLRNLSFDESGEMVLDIAPVGRIRLPLLVPAHATNVLVAVAVGLRHGVTEFEGPLRAACVRAARFHVRTIAGFEILDDTYNANPASMAAALEALGRRPGSGKRFAALGDMLELGSDAVAYHRALGEQAAAAGVAGVFAYGAHAHDIIAGARAAGVGQAEALDSHEAIADALFRAASPGDSILLKGSRGMRMERVAEALEHRALPGGEDRPT
ncbi:MAG: UDP-N-acetylmuramoyl-tripeptide--D-alanyl-D-alanine ligase [Candidatus Hydrogenedentes bacterium]|nr:UDP-N-acetylmuramoyl-tripeptide--D-alanyl-D-alanine ligase [Candidatus Hydrogenedentota bacterium]